MTTCYCQQMLDTGFTGNAKTDAWLTVKYETRRLYDGWFRHVYAWNKWTAGDRDEPPASEPRDQLKTWFEQIEAACPAVNHYPEVWMRGLPGATVYTTYDEEKQAEDSETWEIAQMIATGGRWYDRSDRDYDFEIVREAGARDVLTYQRLTKREQRIVDSVTHTDGTPIYAGDLA